MFDDLKKLAGQLVTNFVTVHFPRNEPLWRTLDNDLPIYVRFRSLGHVLCGEMISVGCYRMAIRNGLWNHGYLRFLDRVEGVPGGGWRIHLFLLDDAAIQLLPKITTGTVVPGDPIGLSPTRFVERRLRQIAQQHRLTGRCDWQNDELP